VSANSGNPVISTPQIMSAGLAATGASFVTSRFGVAGTLLGAALTAMLVTGGSAILRAYLETLTGHVRGMPKKLRSRREQRDGNTFEGATMPGRPDLRDNFAGKMRAALGWFSNLPTLRRRSILMKGLLAAVVAFMLCMVLVWGTEKIIGNSLSCGLWSECPYGTTPGIHPMGYGGTGAGSSLSGGAMNTGGAGPLDRVRQNAGNPFGGGNSFGGDKPGFGNPGGGNPGGGAVPSASSDPAASPAPDGGSASPAGGQGGSASPAAGGQDTPSSVAPRAGQKAAPSSASPASGQ
jgi:hypothetical protein